MYTKLYRRIGKLFLSICALMSVTAGYEAVAAPVSGGGEALSTAGQTDGTTVTGVVTDDQGEPLIGASVLIKGTTTGSITDIDGKFSIDIPAEGATIEISYIGFISQDITVTDQDNLSVTLQPDTRLLDEVVVIGYGTVKKKDLTGSVASVRGDDIAAKKTTTLSTALQGTLSGVLVQRNNNAPGASASSIRVRGVTTMGTSDPLIIVDGIQTDDIDYVNSNDVESITVLKDAAAASIYGSKAAAGVILITTKRGSQTDLNITYNGEFGWEIPTEQPQMVGVTRYLEMQNELLYNDNGGSFYQQWSADQIKNWVRNNATDPDNYPMTDWNNLILKKSAPRMTHTVSVNGGNDVVRSQATISYDEVSALYEGRKFQRYMLRSNNDFTIIKDLLYATLDFNVRRAKNKRPVYDPFDDLRKMPAIYPAIWENGGIASGKNGANPYGLLKEGGTYTAWSTQVGGKASIELRPVKGLSIQAVIAPFINYTKAKQFKKAAHWVLDTDPTVTGGALEGGGTDYSNTSLSETRNDNYHVTSQVLVNYMNTFKEKHNLNLMAGFENYMTKSENLTAGRDQYDLDSYPYLNVGPEDFQTNSGTASEYTSNSVFGRVMYDYDGRYLFQANVRADASSRFAKGHRWGVFPSFSAGWVLSEENWMKSTRNWLSFLKLRASWGQLGNERIGSNYFPYMALVSFNDALFYDENGEVVSEKTSIMNQIAIEDITWETTTSTDIGIDLGFFDQRLHATFDWYWKRTTNMLLDIQIPYSMGYDTPADNAGIMSTQGFDLEIGWNDSVGDFSYNVSLNLSDFQSKIEEINGSQFISGGKIKRAGLYYDEWYGYICEGIYQTAPGPGDATTSSTVGAGDLKYKDISGPDGKPDGVISSEYDAVPLGNSLPRFQYGGQFSCAWKGLDFSLAFQGIGYQLSYKYTEMVQPWRDNYGGFPAILEGKYWSVFNTAEQNANAEYPKLTYTNRSNNYAISDFWLFNGAYFRLKNVTIGYTFPEKWMSKAKIKDLRIYASANDLFSIDNYPQGWDPEMGVTSYPITTSVLLGLSIKF